MVSRNLEPCRHGAEVIRGHRGVLGFRGFVEAGIAILPGRVSEDHGELADGDLRDERTPSSFLISF
jgi:hypothetical protein